MIECTICAAAKARIEKAGGHVLRWLCRHFPRIVLPERTVRWEKLR